VAAYGERQKVIDRTNFFVIIAHNATDGAIGTKLCVSTTIVPGTCATISSGRSLVIVNFSVTKGG